MSTEEFPKRISGLHLTKSADGFLAYQPERDRIHRMNHTAVLVLELASGRASVEGIAEMVGQAYGLDEPPLNEVRSIVATLAQEELIEFRTEGTDP